MKVSLREAGQQAADMTAMNQMQRRCQILSDMHLNASRIILDRHIERVEAEELRLKAIEEQTRQAFWLILLPTIFAIGFLAYMLAPRL